MAGSFSWTWCDPHLMSLYFGELPKPANDAVFAWIAIDAVTGEPFTAERFREWLEAPACTCPREATDHLAGCPAFDSHQRTKSMPDSVDGRKTTGAPQVGPE